MVCKVVSNSDIWVPIISHLDFSGLQSANLVCKGWSEISIRTVRNECENIIGFTQLLNADLITEQETLDLTNRTNLKVTVEAVRSRVFLYIDSSEKKSLAKIAYAQFSSKSLNNMFALARSYQKLKEVDSYADYFRQFYLPDCVKSLARAGDFEKAISVASSLTDLEKKDQTLHYFSQKLANRGCSAMAVKIVEMIEDQVERSCALRYCIFNQIKRGELDSSFELSKGLGWDRIDILKSLHKAYKLQNNLEKAREIRAIGCMNEFIDSSNSDSSYEG